MYARFALILEGQPRAQTQPFPYTFWGLVDEIPKTMRRAAERPGLARTPALHSSRSLRFAWRGAHPAGRRRRGGRASPQAASVGP